MLQKEKTIALVAHDNRKEDLLEWVRWNYKILIEHSLVCTGTTGRLVKEAIESKLEPETEDAGGSEISMLKSGPLGGDQQLGAMIADGKIDMVIFLWDPMQPQPHDVDVKALLRIAVVYNIPIACNRSTADFIISSPLMDHEYLPCVTDYSSYLERNISLRAPSGRIPEDKEQEMPGPDLSDLLD
jgi:methylglyoxal synthase